MIKMTSLNIIRSFNRSEINALYHYSTELVNEGSGKDKPYSFYHLYCRRRKIYKKYK